MQPYISIIMPVYNNEKYLPSAVNSIIDQTFSDWELIIIDDGSTDRTPQIADGLAKKDARIRVIHQDNQWIFRSYNNGYAAAAGKYVFIVNSDDTINPESLQMIYNVSEKTNADIIMFNLEKNVYDEDQNLIEKNVNNYSDLLKEDFVCSTKEEVREKWLGFMKLNLLSRQCIYKISIARKFRYDETYYFSDQFYNIKIADDINVAAGIKYTIYNYHIYKTNDQSLNASNAKYYGYEHEMFNEFLLKYKELFYKWNRAGADEQYYLNSQRVRHLTLELRAYVGYRCALSTNQKLEKMFAELSDDVVYNCAKDADRIEEYESRVLSGLREIFVREVPTEDSRYYFFYELLDKLLAYEKTDEDMEIIRKAVYDPLNPHNIGESFYKKLLRE